MRYFEVISDFNSMSHVMIKAGTDRGNISVPALWYAQWMSDQSSEAVGRSMPSFLQRSVMFLIRATVSGCDENILSK